MRPIGPALTELRLRHCLAATRSCGPLLEKPSRVDQQANFEYLLKTEGRPPVDGNERRQPLRLRSMRHQRPLYGAYLSANGAERAPANDPLLPFAATARVSAVQQIQPVAAARQFTLPGFKRSLDPAKESGLKGACRWLYQGDTKPMRQLRGSRQECSTS